VELEDWEGAYNERKNKDAEKSKDEGGSESEVDNNINVEEDLTDAAKMWKAVSPKGESSGHHVRKDLKLPSCRTLWPIQTKKCW
jgi:hypothetical protein